jgi:molecular chaperone DnaK (HSP70)
LVENAASFLGVSKIKKVVVTIPAYFSKSQIAATLISCEKAGLEAIRSIKESQAIALGIYH